MNTKCESEDLNISDRENPLIKSIVRDDRVELVSQVKRLAASNKANTSSEQNRGRLYQPMDRSLVSKLLHLCCEFDSADCAAALLNGDIIGRVPLINEIDRDTGRSPLHTAAECHSCRCIELLLRKRARTDLKTKDSCAHVALERSLRCSRMDVDWSSEQSVDELILLLGDTDLTAIRLLSEKTKEIIDVAYSIAMEGKVVLLAALLMLAADKVTSVLEVRNEVDLVLEGKAEGHLSFKEKMTVYDCVIREALFLKQLGNSTSLKVIKRSSKLIKNENEELRKLLLCEIELLQFFGAVPWSASTDKRVASPLILASQAGDEAVMKLILQTNIDVNDADADGNTALHWCLKVLKGSSPEQLRILLLLLNHGARVSQKNKLGLTASHIAAANGNPQALEASHDILIRFHLPLFVDAFVIPLLVITDPSTSGSLYCSRNIRIE
ncbi:hypothetical protein Nepgr_017501 [Nepenthes gracilis]|uniref:ANK_REP_REGION domain-containing protein n=1 Tax=Nepenthes gracilis TaxID=150966 RepID=A0AAD3XTE8_NEPGR|nr:hypothetical protein Nepgr_017501 [Nepenthes gracilis]